MSTVQAGDIGAWWVRRLGDDGRAECLFGSNAQALKEVCACVESTVVLPSLYVEVPLLGRPGFDVMMQYEAKSFSEPYDMLPRYTPRGSVCDKGGAWVTDGYESLIQMLLRAGNPSTLFGYEFDASASTTREPSVFFRLAGSEAHALMPDILGLLKLSERRDALMRTLEVFDAFSDSYAFGIMPGRPQVPLRICCYLDSSKEQPGIVALLKQMSFDDICEKHRDHLTRIEQEVGCEGILNFDLMPNGSLGSTFGWDVCVGGKHPVEQINSLTSGRGSRLLELMRSMGVADARVAHMVQAVGAWKYYYLGDAQNLRSCTVASKIDHVKFIWSGVVEKPAKVYYHALVLP